MYRLIRPLLFALDPEVSHEFTLRLLRGMYRLPGAAPCVRACLAARTPALPVTVMGIELANPVGLAAGLDKDATCLEPLADFGFGWLELGTVTPRAQPGNPKKRLFRLVGQEALINRMGFNSRGLDGFIANLKAQRRPCPLGINLGKNRDTPADRALDDYLIGLRAVYPYADYVAVNVSSPNTPGLRMLQDERPLRELLAGLKAEQAELAARHGRTVPIALKIAPDLDDNDTTTIARLLLEHDMDGVIATNTTITRAGLAAVPRAAEPGGLSGRPLAPLATRVIRRLYAVLQGRVPIIGVGGIASGDDAWEKLMAGADCVQIYTALIYQGPGLVRRIVGDLAWRLAALGAATPAEARARHP